MNVFTQGKKQISEFMSCQKQIIDIRDNLQVLSNNYARWQQSGEIAGKLDTCLRPWNILQQQHSGRKHPWDHSLDIILVSVFFTMPPHLHPYKEKLNKNK